MFVHITHVNSGKFVDCRLVVVMLRDCRLRTAASGLLFYPGVIAMWTLIDEIG
jgi:hypothetical protein